MMVLRIKRRRQLMATFTLIAAAFSTDAYLFSPGLPLLKSSSKHRVRPSSSLLQPKSRIFPSSIAPLTTRNRPKSRLFYVDEWADADYELAFNPKNIPVSPNTKRSPFFKRLTLQFISFLLQIKEVIRTRIERCTVYVLELENGKYYVGSTTNRKRRIQEHIRRRGSKWTREHKPIKVLQEYRRIPSKYIFGMESQITAECMLKFGVNNVRGSMFCSTREFHLGDVDSLTKFLGHYNDLRYKKVSARLLQTLPPAPRRYKTSNNGKCFSCGKFGHFAANCPEKKEDSNVFM